MKIERVIRYPRQTVKTENKVEIRGFFSVEDTETASGYALYTSLDLRPRNLELSIQCISRHIPAWAMVWSAEMFGPIMISHLSTQQPLSGVPEYEGRR